MKSKTNLVLLTISLLFNFCKADGASIAAKYGLASSTALAFPSATMTASDASAFITSKWSLNGGISFGKESLSFVSNPIGGSSSSVSSNSEGAVLAVTYDAGTYSHGTGGANFYSTFGGEQGFEAMLLTYDIAFDEDFDWVKGGKLPGLRGGPNTKLCSGGLQPTGNDCFSTRMMWRTDGEGEVYVYIPAQEALCNVAGVICNSDYGFSMGRGKLKFTAGQWQNIGVYAKMNDPPSESNGVVAMFFNGEQVFSLSGIKFRTGEAVTAGGMYFSTFFGGNDKSWATPKTVHSYYRNFQIFGGAGLGGTPGNSTNSPSTSQSSGSSTGSTPSSSSPSPKPTE